MTKSSVSFLDIASGTYPTYEEAVDHVYKAIDEDIAATLGAAGILSRTCHIIEILINFDNDISLVCPLSSHAKVNHSTCIALIFFQHPLQIVDQL